MSSVPVSRRVLRIVPSPSTRLSGDEPVDVVPTAADRNVRALIGEDRPATPSRPRTIEVVVDGWRFELEVEDSARAVLRSRATRARVAGPGSGRHEVHAMIPGRVAAVTVTAGDVVTAGQTLLVVEAMKMQNELRTPRDGVVERVLVGVGETIDLGDLLVVLA